jgi:hypothetical protein
MDRLGRVFRVTECTARANAPLYAYSVWILTCHLQVRSMLLVCYSCIRISLIIEPTTRRSLSPGFARCPLSECIS